MEQRNTGGDDAKNNDDLENAGDTVVASAATDRGRGSCGLSKKNRNRKAATEADVGAVSIGINESFAGKASAASASDDAPWPKSNGLGKKGLNRKAATEAEVGAGSVGNNGSSGIPVGPRQCNATAAPAAASASREQRELYGLSKKAFNRRAATEADVGAVSVGSRESSAGTPGSSSAQSGTPSALSSNADAADSLNDSKSNIMANGTAPYLGYLDDDTGTSSQQILSSETTPVRDDAQPTEQPGAHHGGTQQHASVSSFDSSPVADSPATPPQVSLEGLATARPVSERHLPNIEALPVDTDEMERKEARKRDLRRCFFLGTMLLVLVAMVIALGLIFWMKRENKQYPTEAPSLAPTSAPSAFPTGSLDLLMEGLPNHTQQSLAEFGTPQWKAWDWLSDYQNIASLPEWRQEQLFAMATFFYSFGGEHWNPLVKDRWMDVTKDECHWFSTGLGQFTNGTYKEYPKWEQKTPCNEHGQFILLDLSQLQLENQPVNPFIPREISMLTALKKIKIVRSGVRAPLELMLPAELRAMSNFTEINLGINFLSGSVPTEIGLWTRLEIFSIGGGELTGTVPSELGLLTNLDFLSLANNNLASTLPTELGRATKLARLYMERNFLNGAIPFAELAQMSGLEELNLNSNNLNGSISTSVGQMTSLKSMYLETNRLEGPIPTEVGLMTSLQTFHVHKNNLSGLLPEELNETIGLRLDDNSFTGTVPSNLCTVLWCDDCTSNSTPSLVSTCSDLIDYPAWPGRSPKIPNGTSDTLVPVALNVRTDIYPEDISWVWEQSSNNSNMTWELVQGSDGPLQFEIHLYSHTFLLAPGIPCRLVITDRYKDGFFYFSWMSMLGSNQRILYNLGTDGSVSPFSQLIVVLEVLEDGNVYVVPEVVA